MVCVISDLGRSLMTQTLTLKMNGFPYGNYTSMDVWDRIRYRGGASDCLPFRYNNFNWREIPLPYPPYQSNLAITYLDSDGTTQTLSPSVYRLVGGGHGLSKVSLRENQSWPGALYTEESGIIQWTAGYGSTGDKVPAPLRYAILLMIGHLYENRQSVVVDASRVQAIELPQGVQSLIAPYRVFS